MRTVRIVGCLALLHCGGAPDPTTESEALDKSSSAVVPAVVVSVDCAAPDHATQQQVTYRRGFVLPVNSDSRDVGASVDASMALTKPNLVTATLDLDSIANSNLFVLAKQGESLERNPAETFFSRAMTTLRSRATRNAVPAFVQVSGTPAVVPSTWIEPGFVSREGATGNFYPLPTGDRISNVERAVADWILAQEAIPGQAGNVWIGTQEPSHTLGFPASCADSSSDSLEKLACRKANVDRFVDYWKPIAAALRRHDVKVGGIQLNSHDRDIYSYAAERIVATRMPLDYFTIQRYSSFEDLVPNAYAAYQRLHGAAGYEHVKVAFDRYSYDNNQTNAGSREYFTTAAGMISFLTDERQIMDHADMMYGYSYQSSGLTETGSLLPRVMEWLQRAPAPLRSVSVGPTTKGVEAFALVQTDASPRAYVAVWNVSSQSQVLALELGTSSKSVFADKTPVLLKGSGTTITSQTISIRGNKLSAITLAPNELALVSVE